MCECVVCYPLFSVGLHVLNSEDHGLYDRSLFVTNVCKIFVSHIYLSFLMYLNGCTLIYFLLWVILPRLGGCLKLRSIAALKYCDGVVIKVAPKVA